MISWIKNIFKSPKDIIALAIDYLDGFVPVIGIEIEKIQDKFNALTAQEKAQWLVDQVQAFLRRRFGIPPEAPKSNV